MRQTLCWILGTRWGVSLTDFLLSENIHSNCHGTCGRYGGAQSTGKSEVSSGVVRSYRNCFGVPLGSSLLCDLDKPLKLLFSICKLIITIQTLKDLIEESVRQCQVVTVCWRGRQAPCCRPNGDWDPVCGSSQGMWLPWIKMWELDRKKKVRKLRGKRENKYAVHFQHNSVESGIHCFSLSVILWFMFLWTWYKVLCDVYCTAFQGWCTEPYSMSEILENSPWFNLNSLYKSCPNLKMALHFLLPFTLVFCL